MSIETLSVMTPDERQQLGTMLEMATFAEGEVLWSEGDAADALHMIYKGEVGIWDGGNKEGSSRYLAGATLMPGNFVGVEALAEAASCPKRSFKAFARSEVTVYRLPRAKAAQLGDLQQLISTNSMEVALRNVGWFLALARDERLAVLKRHGRTVPAMWTKGEVVVQAGTFVKPCEP